MKRLNEYMSKMLIRREQKKISSFNRRLVIITNNGGPSNYIGGVNVDLKNYSQFFRSNEGGAWDEEEIYCPEPNSFTPLDLYRYIQEQETKNHIDFWLIVFLGHGFNYQGNVMFEFTPNDKDCCSEADIRHWTSNSRCLMISDSCHKELKYKTGGKIYENEQRSFSSAEKLERKEFKECYNKQLITIPPGSFSSYYAASDSQCAGENEQGGFYTQCLLACAKKMYNNTVDKTYPYSLQACCISYIHEKAKDNLELVTNGEQVPAYKTNSRFASFPFVIRKVDAPKLVPRSNRII